jgi:hypothetical protein
MPENPKIGPKGRFRLSPPKLNVPKKRTQKKFKLSPPKLQPKPKDKEVHVDTADIVDEMVLDDSSIHETFDTSNFRSGVWGAAKPKAEHVALAISPGERFDSEAVARLAEIPNNFAFSFHELVNGEVASDVVARMLMSANGYLFPQGRVSDLQDFIGDETIPISGFVTSTGPGGLYDFPHLKEAEIIANKLGWSARVFKDFVVAAGMKQEELHESGRIKEYIWSDNLHLKRLYRLLRMGQGFGVTLEAGRYLQTMLEDQKHQDRIMPKHVVELYGKGASVKFDDFIDAANILEVILNATWGEREKLEVPREIAEDGFTQWPPEENWHENRNERMLVRGSELAELAFNRMRGDNLNELGAAIMYSTLAEDHLYDIEVKGGHYDFYTQEEARAIAVGDMRENPERYYEGIEEHSKLPRYETFSEKLAKERLKELFEGTRFDDLIKKLKKADDLLERDRALFSNMKINKKWVRRGAQWHHARRFLYGFVAMARFVEAGDAVEDYDPMVALNCYRSARILIGRHYRRREFMYSFESDELGINLRNIVQPLRYWIRDLKKDLDKKIDKMTEKVRQGLINDGSGGPHGGVSISISEVNRETKPGKAAGVNSVSELVINPNHDRMAGRIRTWIGHAKGAFSLQVQSLRWYLGSPVRA